MASILPTFFVIWFSLFPHTLGTEICCINASRSSTYYPVISSCSFLSTSIFLLASNYFFIWDLLADASRCCELIDGIFSCQSPSPRTAVDQPSSRYLKPILRVNASQENLKGKVFSSVERAQREGVVRDGGGVHQKCRCGSC